MMFLSMNLRIEFSEDVKKIFRYIFANYSKLKYYIYADGANKHVNY